MSTLNPELLAIADDIIAMLPFIAPTDMQQIEMDAALTATKKSGTDVRFRYLLLAGLYIEDQIKADPTLEKDALLRLVANDFLWLCCWMVRSLKKRVGEEIAPARVALVAYAMAEAVLESQWVPDTADLLNSDNGSLREAINEQLVEKVTGPHIDIVFDGPPAGTAPSFIEIEDAQGTSISFGEWIERKDGYWALRIPRAGGAA